jgi:hypothetical protein
MLGVRLAFGRDLHRSWLSSSTVDWFWEAAERHAMPVMVFATGLIPEIALDVAGEVIAGLYSEDEAAGGFNQHGLGRCSEPGYNAGIYAVAALHGMSLRG